MGYYKHKLLETQQIYDKNVYYYNQDGSHKTRGEWGAVGMKTHNIVLRPVIDDIKGYSHLPSSKQ